MTTRRAFIRNTAAMAGVIFTGCSLLDAAPARAREKPGASRLPVMVKGKRVKTIDVHAHCLIPEALALLPSDEAQARYPSTKGADQFDLVLKQRLAGMDAQGVDMEVLSINPWWYRKDRDLAEKIVKAQNEGLAALCAKQPDRLAAFGSLALQFPDLAVRQLGASQVVVGTDHPIPWEQHPVDHVMATDSLSDADKAAILGGNAAKLLGIAV